MRQLTSLQGCRIWDHPSTLTEVELSRAQAELVGLGYTGPSVDRNVAARQPSLLSANSTLNKSSQQSCGFDERQLRMLKAQVQHYRADFHEIIDRAIDALARRNNELDGGQEPGRIEAEGSGAGSAASRRMTGSRGMGRLSVGGSPGGALTSAARKPRKPVPSRDSILPSAPRIASTASRRSVDSLTMGSAQFSLSHAASTASDTDRDASTASKIPVGKESKKNPPFNSQEESPFVSFVEISGGDGAVVGSLLHLASCDVGTLLTKSGSEARSWERESAATAGGVASATATAELVAGRRLRCGLPRLNFETETNSSQLFGPSTPPDYPLSPTKDVESFEMTDQLGVDLEDRTGADPDDAAHIESKQAVNAHGYVAGRRSGETDGASTLALEPWALWG